MGMGLDKAGWLINCGYVGRMTQSPFDMLTPEVAADRFGTGPVPARTYHEVSAFAEEVEAIFKRSWLHVAHICELPQSGSFVRRELEFAHASLLIVRGKDNEIRSFHNVCTHRGTQLTDAASGRQGQFSCPYHRWTFGINGNLLSAPDFERFNLKKSDCGLKQVATQILGGMVYVNLSLKPRETVREQFGALADIMDRLPVAKATGFTEWTYEIEANWKVHFDNFQENYHVRFIHPKTAEQIIGPENPMGYPTHYGFYGPHRSQALWKNPAPPPLPDVLKITTGRSARLPQAYADSFEKVDMKLFPCLHIVWLSPDSQFSHTHIPIGPSRTRGSVRVYWVDPPENASRAFAREFATMSLRDVLSEDRSTVEAAQRGLASGALHTINMQEHEVLLRHFHQQVAARVDAWREEQ
jgi:phenylpropionate dioxygenase-like ring-hydroxylating dioxygenase large terminal subunit